MLGSLHPEIVQVPNSSIRTKGAGGLDLVPSSYAPRALQVDHTLSNNHVGLTARKDLEERSLAEAIGPNVIDGASEKTDEIQAQLDDDIMEYSNFPRFEEIRAFLVNSDSFHNLRRNLRSTLHPNGSKYRFN